MTQSSVDALLRDVEAVLVELEAALRIIDGSAQHHYSGNSHFDDVEQALTYIKSWVNERRGTLFANKDEIANFIIQFEQNEFYKQSDPLVLTEIQSRLRKLATTMGF